MNYTECYLMLPNGQTLGWQISQEQECIAFRDTYFPDLEIFYSV
jgi:hypothetical protein